MDSAIKKKLLIIISQFPSFSQLFQLFFFTGVCKIGSFFPDLQDSSNSSI